MEYQWRTVDSRLNTTLIRFRIRDKNMSTTDLFINIVEKQNLKFVFMYRFVNHFFSPSVK